MPYSASGSIAADLIAAVRSSVNPDTGLAGNLTFADLAQYRPVLRTPSVTSYGDGFTIVGHGLPSSGGLTTALAMGVLDGVGLSSMVPFKFAAVKAYARVNVVALAFPWMSHPPPPHSRLNSFCCELALLLVLLRFLWAK